MGEVWVMMVGDRITLGFIAVVCIIGAAALLASGHQVLCLYISGVGCFAWHVATRDG